LDTFSPANPVAAAATPDKILIADNAIITSNTKYKQHSMGFQCEKEKGFEYLPNYGSIKHFS
jgi:hypothetical protein